MSKPILPGDPWQYTTWEGAELADLLIGRQTPLDEKLAWIEEMTPWARERERASQSSEVAEEPHSNHRSS